MRGRSAPLAALGLLVLAAAAPADVLVPGNWAVTAWDPSAGGPSHYAVYVSRNGGGFPAVPERITGANARGTILVGNYGDVLAVRVAAYDEVSGQVSPFSEVSPTIRFYDRTAQDPWQGVESLLVNGSFEAGDDPGSFRRVRAGGTDLAGWEVTGHSVDWIGSAWSSWDGSRSIDMNGGDPGGLAQEIDTEPGRRYAVVFSLAANPLGGPSRKTLRVRVGDTSQDFTFDATGRTTADMGWYTPPFLPFEADGARTRLELLSIGGDSGYGPALDAVAVYPLD